MAPSAERRSVDVEAAAEAGQRHAVGGDAVAGELEAQGGLGDPARGTQRQPRVAGERDAGKAAQVGKGRDLELRAAVEPVGVHVRGAGAGQADGPGLEQELVQCEDAG